LSAGRGPEYNFSNPENSNTRVKFLHKLQNFHKRSRKGVLMKIAYLVVLMLLLSNTSPSFATLYKWTDDQGQIHYTDDIKKIPEKHKVKAKDFDKIEQGGSVTYDPNFRATEKKTGDEEPFYKKFLRQLEEEKQERARAENKENVILYMTDW
jgi:hypothetical protein